MKKLTLALVAVFAISSASFADVKDSTSIQSSVPTRGIFMGFKAGANLHSAESNNLFNFGQQYTYQAGFGFSGFVAIDFSLSKYFGFEVDLGWIKKGWVTLAPLSYLGEIHATENAIALPILAKVKVPAGIFVPQIGIGIEPYFLPETHTVNGKTQKEGSLGFALLGSVGFNLYFTPSMSWSLEARYSRSITDFFSLNLQEITALTGLQFKI